MFKVWNRRLWAYAAVCRWLWQTDLKLLFSTGSFCRHLKTYMFESMQSQNIPREACGLHSRSNMLRGSNDDATWKLVPWNLGCADTGKRTSVCYCHSRRASQGSWSRRTIPNKHGRRRDCGCWLQQNDVKITSLDRRPACGHARWGRSASQSTASNDSAVMIGRKKSREYLI